MCFRGAAALSLVVAVFAATLVPAKAQVPSWANTSPAQVTAAKKLGVPVALENSVGMRFVLIPPGTFMMGSRDPAPEVARRCNMPNAQGGWFYDEHPRHKVTLTTAFYLATHEVTQAHYQAVTNPNPKETDKKLTDDYPAEFIGPNHPVVRVAYDHAEKFCKTLGGRDEEMGRQYFLPTEAQWEYACRAGTDTPFSLGATISTDRANYHGDYTYGDGRKGRNHASTLPVGSFPPNPWGLYDMHGNVSEWCASRYGNYSSAAETDPQGPEDGKQRVLRGGSWRSYPGACRSAFRLTSDGRAVSHNVGFRVCCAIPLGRSADENLPSSDAPR